MQLIAKIAILVIALFLEGLWLEKQTTSLPKSKLVEKIPEITESQLAIESYPVKITLTNDSINADSKTLQIGRNTNLGF